MENISENYPGGQDISPSPKIKNKELTKRKLLNAVGEIVRTEGFTGIGTNKIAKKAGVHKKLIYRYFNSTDRLIEDYVVEKDFWMLSSDTLDRQAAAEHADLQASITGILENQFDFFYSEKEMQQLIIWEICGSKLMKSISVAREHLGDKFLKLTDDHFEDSSVNFRALSSLLSSGIYYMILHAPVTPYCGIDLNNPRDYAEVKRTIRQVISMAFAEAKRNKKK